MKKDDIELSPLPEYPDWIPDELAPRLLAFLKDAQMEAIKADRQRRSEPVGYVHPANEHRLYSGETVAFRQRPYDGEKKIPVYLSPQPTEPAERKVDGCSCDQGQVCQVCDPTGMTTNAPSTDEIIGAVKEYGNECANQNVTATQLEMRLHEIRDLLDRYGHLEEPVKHWPDGAPRDARDIASDTDGRLIHDPVEPFRSAKQVPNDDDIYDDFQNWLYLDQTHYEPDDLNKQSKELAKLSWKSAASRYGHSTTLEGWQLVPKELIEFIEAKEHHLPIEDRHALSNMLKAAPKFGEES